jgi:hypothetical protein
MNDPQLALNKLDDLGRAATQASSEGEKAAIFSAVRLLVNDLDEYVPEYLGEKLEQIRWSISAILGYDISNGHSHEQHLIWALGAIDTLRRAGQQISRTSL